MSGSLNPQARYVPAGLRKAVDEALRLGWTAKKSGSGGWTIHSPKGTQSFYVPITAKDPDALATKLRSKMSKAYLTEQSAFEPMLPKEVVDAVMPSVEASLADGVSIQVGTAPTSICKDCEVEFLTWEAFAAHQKGCQERVAAEREALWGKILDLRLEGTTYEDIANAVNLSVEEVQDIVGTFAGDEEQVAVPEGGDDVVEPAEERTEDVPEETQSGTIAHEEETLADTNEGQARTRTRAKRGAWTLTTNDPLHRALYVAIRTNPRRTNETDSKWARRLADYFVEESLLDEVLPEFEPTDEVTAARVLAQIRALVGADEADGLKAKVDELTTANESLRNTLRTFSDLAREATQ